MGLHRVHQKNTSKNGWKINLREEEIFVKKSYPIFLTKTYNYILIEVPDFDILTRGKGTDEAMEIAKNTIELKCVAMEDAGQTMPAPSNIGDLDPAQSTFSKAGETIVSLIEVEPSVCRKQVFPTDGYSKFTTELIKSIKDGLFLSVIILIILILCFALSAVFIIIY